MKKNNFILFMLCVAFFGYDDAMEKANENKFCSMTQEAIKHFLALKVIKNITSINAYTAVGVNKDYFQYPDPKWRYHTKQGLCVCANASNGIMHIATPWGTLPIPPIGDFNSSCLQTITKRWNNITMQPVTITTSIYDSKNDWFYPIIQVEGIYLPEAKLEESQCIIQEEVVKKLWKEMEEQELLCQEVEKIKNKINPVWAEVIKDLKKADAVL